MASKQSSKPNTLSAYLSQHPDFADPSSSSSRLPSLYSDLSRQRQSNPAGYRANVEWWRTILEDVCRKGIQSDEPEGKGKGKDRLVLHADEGMQARWTVEQVGRPLGLGTVIADLSSSSRLVPLQTFLRSTHPISGPSSARGLRAYIPSTGAVASALVGRPISWMLAQFSLSDSSAADENADEVAWRKNKGDWVVWDNLEAAASTLLSAHYANPKLSPLESLFSTEAFRKSLLALIFKEDCSAEDEGGLALTDADVQILLKHLVRDRRVALVDKDVIKLSTTEGEAPLPITEQDRGIVEIRTTHSRLESQVNEIEKRISERNTKIEAALRAKQKNQAMSYLRSRKMLEELLTKRMGALETIQGVVIKIEQAAGDIEVMRAYELSTSTLKGLLAHPSLQHDRVQDTMEQLSDTLADHAEIDGALQAGGEDMRRAVGVEEIDDKELEEELEMLAKQKEIEEKEEAERKQRQEREEREERQRKERKEKEQREREQKEKEVEEKSRKEEAEKAVAAPDRSAQPASADAAPASTDEHAHQKQPEAEAVAEQ